MSCAVVSSDWRFELTEFEAPVFFIRYGVNGTACASQQIHAPAGAFIGLAG
jgi:hypothetical protein